MDIKNLLLIIIAGIHSILGIVLIIKNYKSSTNISLAFIIFHPSLLIEQATHYDWGNDANEKLSGHLFYALYFFSYLIWAYRILYNKLKKSEDILKSNLLEVIYVTLIGFIFGFTFDLILPMLGNYIMSPYTRHPYL